MKISKKDLRRIIIENVLGTSTLKEGVNLNSAWRAASNFKKSPQDEDARAELERFKQKLEQHKEDSDGPFRRDKGRATEAQTLLDDINELLEADSQDVDSITLTPPPPEDLEADGVTGVDAPNAAPEDPSAETPDWKKYADETDWEYKIQGESPNEIWVTRKVGGDEKIFKLNNRRYKTTVEKLDDNENMPNRTQVSIDNDPALKAAPARSSGSGSTGTESSSAPQIGSYIKHDGITYKYDTLAKQVPYWKSKDWNVTFNPTGDKYLAGIGSNGILYFRGSKGEFYYFSDKQASIKVVNNSQNKDAFIQSYKQILDNGEVVDEPAESNTGDQPAETGRSVPSPVTFDWGNDDMAFMRKVNKYQHVDSISLKNKTGTQQFDAGTDTKRKDALQKVITWLYDQDIYSGAGGDLSDIAEKNRITVDRAMKVHSNWKADSSEEYRKILDLPRNPVGGRDVGPRWKTVLEYTYELFARINERYYAAQRRMNENKVVYGESHASLIRKRYWGRY